MSTAELFAKMTTKTIGTLGDRQAVSYQGANRTVATIASIFLETEFTGIDVQAIEPRWLAAIDRADIQAPRRGDVLRDSMGQDWILSERISQDQWMDVWALQSK